MVDPKQSLGDNGVFRYVVGILAEICNDCEVGEISLETRLGDIIVESISLVYFIGELQQHFGLQNILFDRLRANGTPLTDLRVADVVELIDEILAAQGVGVGGARS